ncbi:hypothetical protein [Pseudanabaena sp. PCC 6802]|uniref:hypothetical protein n=1 Tax=Pseudanabaena sp. PCC 6802 TaxID=118173 RepID=UPI000345682E|nr:hypothetical protein [Pseudanabaena sp. PCC 6802]
MQFFLLDPQDPFQRNEYERAFFQAFANLTSNRLVRKLWLWDDTKQTLRTRIPYDRQLIYAVRDSDGILDAALAVNYKPSQFQSAAFGFSPPASDRQYCELINIFSLRNRHLHRLLQLLSYCFTDLRQQGCQSALGTTAERPLRSYLWAGAHLLAQTEIDGEKRYFFEFPESALDRWARADIDQCTRTVSRLK